MSICDKCHNYKLFGKDCYFFWYDKRECSKFCINEDDEEHFAREE